MSKTQVGIGEAVGLILGLIGVGIQMLWPEQKWLGWVFIGLGIAIGFGVVIWIWAQRVALKSVPVAIALSSPPAQSLTQHAPITNTNTNTNNPIFAPVFAPNFTQSATQSQAARPKPIATRDPVFECRGTRFRRYGFNLQTGELIREQYEGDPSEVAVSRS